VPAILRSTERAPVSQPEVRIVGVLPPRLRLPLVTRADGLVLDEETATGSERVFTPLVRLAPGVTVRAAEARLGTVQVPGEPAVLRLIPIRKELAAQQDPVLWLLLAAAGIVLLTACVNLANLTIAQGAARVRELAIRASLGSSRGQLIRLLLVEAMCIASWGTGVGLIAGYWATRTLTAALPPRLATAADPVFDVRAFLFSLFAATAAAAFFGVIPALRLTRAGGHEELRSATQLAAVTRRGAQVLVAAEVGVCVALVIGAALVGRTLFALVSQDLGFAPHRVAVNFDLPTMVVVRDGALRTDIEARTAFYRARLRDVREVPGVHAAALASGTPFSGMAPDAPLMPGQGDQAGGVYGVSSGYFTAMGIPLLAGRDFTDEESFGAAPVGVLNLTAARLLCGGLEACLGRVIAAPKQPARSVIGVVADARPSLEQAQLPAMYVPFLSRFSLKTLVISADDTTATNSRIKRALSVSREARVDMRALDDALDRELSPYRFNAILIGGFAALTLLLALVGVYGVMMAIVTQRTREYGVRLALGATPRRVNRHVLGVAALPLASGVTGGVVLAAWSSRFIGSLLYGVVPLDGASFAAAAALLLVCGLAASAVPAIRAGRVDPIGALRAE
jgi:predicted permease